MKKENSSSLKKLEMLFSKISETQERYIMISCSHVFSDKISFYIEKLKSQYQIIDFDDILNRSIISFTFLMAFSTRSVGANVNSLISEVV